MQMLHSRLVFQQTALHSVGQVSKYRINSKDELLFLYFSVTGSTGTNVPFYCYTFSFLPQYSIFFLPGGCSGSPVGAHFMLSARETA